MKTLTSIGANMVARLPRRVSKSRKDIDVMNKE